jgi:hypothetical protein
VLLALLGLTIQELYAQTAWQTAKPAPPQQLAISAPTTSNSSAASASAMALSAQLVGVHHALQTSITPQLVAILARETVPPAVDAFFLMPTFIYLQQCAKYLYMRLISIQNNINNSKHLLELRNKLYYMC